MGFGEISSKPTSGPDWQRDSGIFSSGDYMGSSNSRPWHCAKRFESALRAVAGHTPPPEKGMRHFCRRLNARVDDESLFASGGTVSACMSLASSGRRDSCDIRASRVYSIPQYAAGFIRAAPPTSKRPSLNCRPLEFRLPRRFDAPATVLNFHAILPGNLLASLPIRGSSPSVLKFAGVIALKAIPRRICGVQSRKQPSRTEAL